MSIITHRNNTKRVKVGELYIGGANEVIIQSMTTTKTHDIEATVEQINRLAKAGCQLVRVACLDETDAKALKEIKERITIPLVVDIHFDYRLALAASTTWRTFSSFPILPGLMRILSTPASMAINAKR